MATRIIEYAGKDRIDGLPVVPAALTVQTPITASGTSQQSAAFNVSTNMIAVQSDEAVHVARAANPTATTSNYKITAGSTQFFTVTPGEKVAIIAGT
jgi:hypothetical protein